MTRKGYKRPVSRSINRHNKKQFIYVMSNPAFPGWYKIGRSTNVKERLRNYQTNYPLRDSIINFYIEVINPLDYERIFKHEIEGEWIKCELETIINIIKTVSNIELNAIV